MNFDEDTLLLLKLFVFVMLFSYFNCHLKIVKSIKHWWPPWVTEWLRRRKTLVAYNTIVSEVQLQDIQFPNQTRSKCFSFQHQAGILFFMGVLKIYGPEISQFLPSDMGVNDHRHYYRQYRKLNLSSSLRECSFKN